MTKPTPLQPVDSSMFSHAAYDPATQVLTVRLKDSGDTYRYDGVSAERGQGLMESESMGRRFNRDIKPFHDGEKI